MLWLVAAVVIACCQQEATHVSACDKKLWGHLCVSMWGHLWDILVRLVQVWISLKMPKIKRKMCLYDSPSPYKLGTSLFFWFSIFVEILHMPDVTGTHLWKICFSARISKIIIFRTQNLDKSNVLGMERKYTQKDVKIIHFYFC